MKTSDPGAPLRLGGYVGLYEAVSVAVDVGVEGSRLLFWLSPAIAIGYLATGFWVEFVAVGGAQAWFAKFKHSFDACNCSAFALCEMRRADDEESRPLGPWLMPRAITE